MIDSINTVSKSIWHTFVRVSLSRKVLLVALSFGILLSACNVESRLAKEDQLYSEGIYHRLRNNILVL